MTAGSADITQLARDLNIAGQTIEEAAHKVLADVAQNVQALAASMAPVKSGALQRSIHINWVSQNAVDISPTALYGVFQEFGTGARSEFGGNPYTIKPKAKGGVLVFKMGGKTVFARSVTTRGVPPHPFMRPALIQALGPAADEMAKAGALKITRGSQ